MPMLQKIAFCLQVTGQSYFNYKQLTQDLSLSNENIESCCKYTIFKKDTQNGYTFTHNAFKEYLTAKHLSRISFDKLKEIICYPETNILRPNLYNTVILLVSILEDGNPLLSSLIEWLAENKPEILFMCEQHFLSVERCEMIFQTYFEELKKYGENIGNHDCEQIMSFSNTRRTILYLLEESSKETIPTINLSNALSLLRYANLQQLRSDEKKELEMFACQLISQYKDDKDSVNIIYDLFENKYYKTPQKIAELHSILKDCENPVILIQFFRTVQDGGLADEYTDWIISKKEYIKNYETSRGTTMIIHVDPFIDVLTSTQKIDNIIKVLETFNFQSYIQIDRNKRGEIVRQLFANLQSTEEEFTNGHLNKVLDILRSEHIMNPFPIDNTESIVNAYRNFIFDKSLDEPIFMQYYAALKKEMVSPQDNNADHNDFIWEYLNVISTIMTDERFELILNDKELSEGQVFILANRLGVYEIISNNSNWNNEIDSLKKKHPSTVIDHAKSAQDGFDILFDYEKFIAKIQVVADKHKALTSGWEQRLKLQREEGVNESIVDFIWDSVDRRYKSAVIVMEEVVKMAGSLTNFNKFVFHRLIHYLRYNITTEEQQIEKVSILIRGMVDNINSCPEIRYLTELIVAYNIILNDKQLLSLIPYSHYKVKKDDNSLLYNNSFENSFLEHIASNISDKQLIVEEISSIIDDQKGCASLYYTFTEYIVKNRIDSLYEYFEIMLSFNFGDSFSNDYDPHYKQNISEVVLQLGQEGMELIDLYKDSFCEKDRIYYYQMVLKDDKLRAKTSEIIKDLNGIYYTVSKDYQEKILILLLSVGDVEGLKMFLDYYKNNPKSFLYKCPTFTKYSYNQIDVIKQIFEISHNTLYRHELNPIRDTTFNWLNNIAMESEENRDSIVGYYTHLSGTNPEKYSYLQRVSKYLYNKYFEKNSPNVHLSQAVLLYISIC